MANQRDWGDEQFENADFTKEYGVLAYTFEEIRRASQPATTAMQNYAATEVRKKFQSAYDRYVSSYNPQSPQNIARNYGGSNKPLPYSEYFARNRHAYLDVLSQPIDLTPGKTARQPFGGPTPGQLFPTAFNQDTVGGVMNWLTATEIPGILTSLAKPIYGKVPVKMGQDGWPVLDANGHEIPTGERAPLIGRQMSNLPADEINAAWMGGYGSIHLYEPNRGADSANTFSVWFNAYGAKGIEEHRNAERNWKSSSIPMSYAEGGDSDGDNDSNMMGAYSFDGNSGEVSDGISGVLDMATGIESLSRFQNISIMPMSKSTGAPLNVRKAVTNLQNFFGVKDGQEGGWTTFNVQTGQYGSNEDASTLRVLGIDPKSPAGIAGMREGAMIQSLARLFNDPELPTLLDALQNGQPIDLIVKQFNQDKQKYYTEVLSIIPGPMSGRGLQDGVDEDVQEHWIDRIADRTTAPLPTGLFTTSEKYSTGMYQNARGDWQIAPMTDVMGGKFNVPVMMTREAMKAFRPLYERFHEKWTKDDRAFNDAYEKSYFEQVDNFAAARAAGQPLPYDSFDREFRKGTLQHLPRTVPQPGTPNYTTWRSASRFVDQIRQQEKSVDRPQIGGDFFERNIDQWDAYVSSLERYKNPGAPGGLDPKRLALASFEVSSAGNYLKRQRSFMYEPLSKFDEEIRYIGKPRHTNEPFNPLAIIERQGLNAVRRSLAGTLAGFTPAPNERVSYPGDVPYGPWPQPSVNPKPAPPSYSWVEPKSATIPARPEGKYKEAEAEPKGPLPQGADLPNSIGSLDEAAYSERSNLNAGSAFPLGSMNEDDFPWQKSTENNREGRTVTENTFDESIYNGDPGSPEYDELALPKKEPYMRNSPLGQVFDRVTREPIYTQSAEDINARALVERLRKDKDPDPTTTARAEYDRTHPVKDENRELRDTSEAADQGESEIAYAKAFQVLGDPNDPHALIQAKISNAGNQFGFLENSRMTWGDLFTEHKMFEERNESSGTYHALNNVQKSAEQDALELAANYDTLLQGGKKRSIMLSRLGEKDLVRSSKTYGYGPDFAQEIARAVQSGKKPAERYRQTLQQISREYNLILSWQPGKEAELYDQVEELKKSNPEGYARVKSIFATPAEQLALSRQYVDLATSVPAQPKPTGPTSRPARGNSHTYRTPGGKAQAKYSSNQITGMRRGRNIDPVTGQFDPFAMENTTVSAQLAAAGVGGSRGNKGWSIPDYQELSNLQNSITYRDFAFGRDDQQGRLQGQVETYIDKYIGHRKRFDMIRPYNPGADTDGSVLQGLLDETDQAVRSAFPSSGYNIGPMEVAADPDLPAGFIRMGSSVRKEGAQPQYQSDYDPGEPPESAPPDDNLGGGNNAAGGPPEEPPDNTTTASPADPNGTPRPARNTQPTPRPKVNANTDPALFPQQPGAVGWKMQFGRYNKDTGKTKQVTAWSRQDADGNLGWFVRNEAGDALEPLRVNRGSGKIWDENDNLLHDVNYKAAERHEGMSAPVTGTVSSAGNPTPAPASTVMRTPEEWAAFQAPVGTMLTMKTNGYNQFAFAEADPDDPTKTIWMSSAKGGGPTHKITDPGWGQMHDANNNLLADVSQQKYEMWANEQGKVRSTESNRRRDAENARVDKEKEDDRKAQRTKVTTPAPVRTGYSKEFGRFSNAMWEHSGRFQSKFVAAHKPEEFGEVNYGEATKLATMNEYSAQMAALYNRYVDNAPTSADEIMGDIMDLTEMDESFARPIAETLFEDHQKANRQRRPLKKENPMRRSIERATRLDDEYKVQTVNRGPLGFRTHIASKLQDVSAFRDIESFKSQSLGEVSYYPYEDDKGETRWVPRVAIESIDKKGEKAFHTTADENTIAKGFAWSQTAITSALGGELPSSPDAIVATLKERMYQSLSKTMRDEVDNAVKHGQNDTNAGAAAQIVKELGDHFVTKAVEKVKDALGSTEGDVNGGLVAEGTRYDTRIKTAAGIRAKMEEDPVFAAEFRGRSAEEIHAGDEMVVYDSEKRSFAVGGSGKKGGARVSSDGNYSPGPRGNGAGGMFGTGKWGSAFYGAYLLKREWQMSAGQTLASAEKYGEGMANYAGIMYDGAPMGNSDMGFARRQEVGESFMGKAAYSQFGAYMDIPYRLSESGNMGAARVLQTAGISAGVAMGGAITGSMLTMGGMAAAGAALTTGGLIAGGLMLAGVAGMEAYNAWGKPEDAPDVTLSTPVERYREVVARTKASQNRTKALFGDTYDEYVKKWRASDGQILDLKGWKAARQDDALKNYGNTLSNEELGPYFDEEGKQVFADLEMNKRAEILKGQVKKVSGDTLESEDTLTKALGMQKQILGSPDPTMLGSISSASQLLGIGSDQNVTQSASYAAQMGYIQGTPDFKRALYEFALQSDATKRSGMSYSASRISQMGSQIQATMGTDARFDGLGESIARRYNFQTQAQTGAYTSMVQGLQQYGADIAPWRFDQLANLSQQSSPFVSGMIGNAMESFMSVGGSLDGAVDLGFGLRDREMSNMEASNFGRMMQGDLGAYSYQAWQTGNMDNAFRDRAGRPISQYYGSIANQVYNAWAPKVGLAQKTAAQFLGTNNAEILAAWNAPDGNGGMAGLQLLASEKSYQASMASAGISMRGIALTENFNWGASSGGTWNNPTAGSSWGVQDRQLALQDASTRAGFADQWARMTTQNSFSIQNEGLQAQRMRVSQEYQTFQFSQQYNGFQQQQAWTQQDWQYQDTSRAQTFGWQMQDLNEAIRFSSGRERKQLIKQRERLSTTESQESDQIDTQRDRQKQLWAQQEESYQKQKQYTADLTRLDQEGFNLQKNQRETFFKMDTEAYNKRVKEYEEEKKLSDELRVLQRKHEYDQLQLQKESAGVQAAAAAAQHEINKAMIEGNKNMETLEGTVSNMNTYNYAFRLMGAVEAMLQTADGTSTYKIQKIMELLKALSAVNTSKVWGGEPE